MAQDPKDPNKFTVDPTTGIPIGPPGPVPLSASIMPGSTLHSNYYDYYIGPDGMKHPVVNQVPYQYQPYPPQSISGCDCPSCMSNKILGDPYQRQRIREEAYHMVRQYSGVGGEVSANEAMYMLEEFALRQLNKLYSLTAQKIQDMQLSHQQEIAHIMRLQEQKEAVLRRKQKDRSTVPDTDGRLFREGESPEVIV